MATTEEEMSMGKQTKPPASYPAEGHPWADYLHHRMRLHPEVYGTAPTKDPR